MNSDRVAVLFGPQENPKKKTDKTLATMAPDKPLSMLAQQYALPQDFRGREVLFHQVRHGLMAEFSPATFCRQAEIDSLAQDYLWLAHYRKMWEAAALPKMTLTPEEEVTWKRYQAAQAVLPVITRMVTHKILTPPCTPEEAREVAERLARHITSTQEWVAEADAPEEEQSEECKRTNELYAQNRQTLNDSSGARLGQEIDEDEQKEEAEIRAFLTALGDLQERLKDTVYVTAIFTGSRPPTDCERACLFLVLERFYDNFLDWFARNEALERKVEQLRRQPVPADPGTLDTLFRLENQLRKLEETITKKRRRLARCS